MQSQENYAGASEQPEGGASAESQEEAQPTGMQTLAELLAEGEQDGQAETESSGDDDGEPRGSEKKAKPTKFNDLAGALDMDLDALYKLEVTDSEDGTPVTVEALKDAWKQRADLELQATEFEERRTQQESDLMRAKAELQEILQALPKNAVRPDVLERIREKSERTTQQERQKTLEVIPEWRDDKTREAEIAGMAEHLQGYGFPANYLQNVVSHQHLKYIRDNWRREQRVRKALEQVRAGKPDKTPANKAGKKAPKRGGAANVERGKAANKLEAVFSTLE